MNRKSVALTTALAMMALAGCNLTRSDLRQKADQVTATVFNSNSNVGRPGRVIEPRYCRVDTAILLRPVGDKVVDESPWNVADEQVIPQDVRQALEANGLRIGVITGNLPADVTGAFRPIPPQKETQWVHIALPEGEHSPIVLGGKTESVTLLLNHRGKIDGRDYQDAGGRLNVTAGHSGPNDVSLRIVPEIHHGSERRTIAALQNTGPFAPQEFAIKDGQQEDVLRELAATIDVQPGQTVVIGCRAPQARSLGTFLFMQPDAQGDRMLQGVLLLRASRNNAGTPPLKPIEDADDAADAPDLAVRPAPAIARAAKVVKDEPTR